MNIWQPFGLLKIVKLLALRGRYDFRKEYKAAFQFIRTPRFYRGVHTRKENPISMSGMSDFLPKFAMPAGLFAESSSEIIQDRTEEQLKPRIIINLLGTVGVGKGTQGKLLSEKYRLPVLSLGDLYRDECRGKTPIGNLISLHHTTHGQSTFAPDEIAYGLLLKKIADPAYKRGFILDGFPRTAEQTKIYNNSFLRQDDIHIPIWLSLDETAIYSRLEHRYICSQCGKQVRQTDRLAKAEYCPDCNIKLVKRGEDSSREKIDQRLLFFKEHIPKVIPVVALRDRVSIIHADISSTPQDIFKRIEEVIEKKTLFFPELTPPVHGGQKYESMESTIFDLEVLKRVSSFFPQEFAVSSLHSFSNDNFLLANEKEKIVIRIPGRNMQFLVDRHSEYKNSLLAQKAGFNPLEILYFDSNDGLQVTRYLTEATFLSINELHNKEIIYKIVDLLKKLHECGIIFENKFNPFCRLKKILNFLKIQNEELSAHFHGVYPYIDQLEGVFEWHCFENKPCHNDPVPSNFALISNSFKLIDWEYSGNNDPAWDLAYFSSILALSSDRERFLINSYSSEKADIIEAKMTFFKPVIHLTISAWAALQALENSPKLSKNQFESMSTEHFEKYRQLILSEDFNLSIMLLKKYS